MIYITIDDDEVSTPYRRLTIKIDPYIYKDASNVEWAITHEVQEQCNDLIQSWRNIRDQSPKQLYGDE